jgi:hypothetical protein
VLHPARAVSHTVRLTRELLLLVAIVLIDGGFIAVHLLTPLGSATGTLKLGYTVLWTGVTLGDVLRRPGRIRALRLQPPGRTRQVRGRGGALAAI